MGDIMPILLDEPITESDLEEYLNGYSDFSFELQVLNKFIELGFTCEHSGTYDDPITEKSREFDIRALYTSGPMRLRLSVECKNLRDNFPLILHCLQRKRSESYNEIICTFDPEKLNDNLEVPVGVQEFSRSIRLNRTGYTLYEPHNYVAKSGDQVGRKRQDKSIVSTDSGVFDKISQSLNSAYDFVTEAQYLEVTGHSFFSLIIPVLVVPDNTLWQSRYDEQGSRQGNPEKIGKISYFVGKEWFTGGMNSITYSISHLEIVTFSEIENFAKDYLLDYLDNCKWIISEENEFKDIPK